MVRSLLIRHSGLQSNPLQNYLSDLSSPKWTVHPKSEVYWSLSSACTDSRVMRCFRTVLLGRSTRLPQSVFLAIEAINVPSTNGIRQITSDCRSSYRHLRCQCSPTYHRQRGELVAWLIPDSSVRPWHPLKRAFKP